jgi:hypothetical protein
MQIRCILAQFRSLEMHSSHSHYFRGSAKQKIIPEKREQAKRFPRGSTKGSVGTPKSAVARCELRGAEQHNRQRDCGVREFEGDGQNLTKTSLFGRTKS